MRWRGPVTAGVAAMVVALSVAASTASAATPQLAGAFQRWHRWSLTHAGVLPQFNFAAAVALGVGPREVMIGGTRYEMDLSAFEFPGSPPVTPFVFVDLQRAAPLVAPTAFQLHEYAYSPQTGATFTFDKKTLGTATLDMGSSIPPSTLATTYTAAGPASTSPCRLVTGGHGFQRQSTGTVAYSAFNIVTPTSPFFGTLTSGPVRAQMFFDPGCAGDEILGSGPGGPQRCPGREGLVASTPTQEWSFGKIFGQRAVDGAVFTGTNPNVPSVTSESHAVIAETSVFSLPRPSHSGHGATARVFAGADPFMTGSGTFTSTRKPEITRRHKCIAHGRIRRFITFKYGGMLAPDASPLTAVFDTTPLALTPLKATLVLHLYP